MKEVSLYTDGACRGNPGPGGWGAILVYGRFEKELSGGEIETTNNRMELLGAINGLEALKEPLKAIIDTICLVIERTPPELLGDIYKNGIVLTGGGSKLTGLDKLIENATGIRTYLAKDPISCVVLGTGKSLEELEGGAKGFFASFGN